MSRVFFGPTSSITILILTKVKGYVNNIMMNHGPEAPVQIDLTAFQEPQAPNPYGQYSEHFDAEGYSIDNPYAPQHLQHGQGQPEAAVEYPQTNMFEGSGEVFDQPVSRVRLAARGLARWVRQKFSRGDRQQVAEPETHEADTEAEAFWGERHSIARAQSFSEQVAEVRMQPWERQNVIHADPKTILDTRMNRIRRSRDTFTEQEGMEDLDSFLLDVITTASHYNDPKSAEMIDAANRMRRNFNFLGKKEYEVACEGIAHAWKEHLTKHPDAVINVFNPRTSEEEPLKSYNVVLSDIQSKFAALTEDDPAMAAKLRTDPQEWADDSKHDKLLVVDDWITSGTTIRNNAADAIRLARSLGLDGLARKTEAHVLITRQGEPRWHWDLNNGRDSFALRSYYETDTRDYYSPSGSHSSVDYTFETPLEGMADYLKGRGVQREVPLLAHIQRRYGEAQDEPRDMHATISQNTLHEIGVLNGVMRQINTEVAMLERQTDAKSIYMLAANRDSARAVEARIATLSDQYAAMQAHRSEIDAHSKPVGIAA